MGSGILLTKAVEKYGISNFKKQYIEFIFTSKKDVSAREIYWIEKFKNKYKGNMYNLTRGGDGFRGNHSVESKIKIGIGASNKVITNEFRQKMSKLMIGRSKSISHRTKLSQALKGRARSSDSIQKGLLKTQKAVDQFNLDGVYLASYVSMQEASNSTKINRASINLNCLGKLKTAGGFIWRYKK
jgi:group I intron endonuclease